MTAPSTLIRPEVIDPELSEGDPKYAHYTKKMGITDAYIFGTPLTALCGLVWVPSRDPKHLPVCPQCKKLAEMLWGDEANGIE